VFNSTELTPAARKKKQAGFSILELLVVVVVIGILIITAYRYLQDHVVEAEKAALRSISRDFATSMSMLRHKWIIEGRRVNQQGQRTVKLDEHTLYLNQNGWPIRSNPAGRNQILDAEDCADLWHTIMQYSVEVSIEGIGNKGQASYHISTPNSRACRYELSRMETGHYYFDYKHENGEVLLNVK